LKIYVVVPTLNEEKTIGAVVRAFKKEKKISEVIVYDGNSTDRTREIAAKNGAKVFRQRGRGKGKAIQEIFEKIDTDIYVFADGDNTYPADKVNELIRPIETGQADMVIGSRMNKKSEPGSISRMHFFGNKMINMLFRLCFREKLTDILSAYRAVHRSVAKEIVLTAIGFEVESELTIKAVIGGYRIKEVPIEYRKRPRGSKSKLNSIADGKLIIGTILSIFRDYKPMLFFSVLSVSSFVLGMFFGVIVLEEWISTGFVSRLPLAILSTLLILSSLLLFMTGLIISSINRMNHEFKRSLRRL